MPSLPTSRADWRLLARTVRLVLGHPSYAAIAILAGLLAAMLMAVSLHLQFAVDVLGTDGISVQLKFGIVLSMLPFVGSQGSAIQGIALYAIAALAGASIAVLAANRIERDGQADGGGESAASVVVALLGAGSAACGPAMLAGVAGILGLDGVLATLPFHGLEGSMLAAVVLVLSTYWLADGMRGAEIRGSPVDQAEDGAKK